MDIKLLKTQAQKEINSARDLKKLDEVWRKYLGKKSKISKVFKDLKTLSENKRKKVGSEINKFKKEVEDRTEEKRKELKIPEKERKEMIDVTLPGEKIELGHLHPLTNVLWECENIFEKMGFQVVEGPEIENEWYNFDALNIPKDHPARDLWDTLWLQDNQKSQISNTKSQTISNIQYPISKKLLLRTHTSPNQVRFMEKNNPPLRIVVPGRVFRYEATDPSHEIQFYQLEGLIIDKSISLANLKAILIEFFKNFFGQDIKVRFRPGYFPFTEPSIEADVKLKEEWVETLGAGMVHPNVLKAVRLNPQDWQGFAFGMGVDRLAMMKYKINDIRLFYKGDLKFLEQF